jgi:CHAD domain-containing protein
VRDEVSVVRLESTYYDTTDFSLLRYGVTLRRREGDDDTGWHLKVPTGSARTEIRLPLEAGSPVPSRLSSVVAGIAVGELAPVAIVRTTRERTRIFDGDRLLIELAADEVTGTALGATATVTTWHELEVELGDEDDENLLTEVADRLVAAGAAHSTVPSKLARTIEWSDPIKSAVPAAPDAHGLIMQYLTAQLLEIGSSDIAFRRGLDPVHKARVAARRFRSVLRVFRDAWLEPSSAERLDEELSWYQNLLGELRDRHVLRTRLADSVHSLPDALVLGPVAAAIDEKLVREHVIARDALRSAIDSDRYLAVLRATEQWATEPPIRVGVDLGDVQRMTTKAQRTARKRLKKALATGSPEMLHRARKASKRARYATELAAPVAGKSAAKQVKVYKRVQDALGEHQDSAIAAAELHRLGIAANGPDENGFTFGLLYERERLAAERARGQARALLARVP